MIKVNFIEYTNKKITNPMIIISSDDNNKNGSRKPPVKVLISLIKLLLTFA
jgi:hypothetical protein